MGDVFGEAVLGWAALGAVAGAAYAWRRLPNFPRAIAAVRADPAISEPERRGMVLHLHLRRLRSCALIALLGAIVGSLFGAAVAFLVVAIG